MQLVKQLLMIPGNKEQVKVYQLLSLVYCQLLWLLLTKFLPTVNPLDRPPKISELLNQVAAKATDKWKMIGYQLDIEHHHLKSISKNNEDDLDCYAEVFSLWQRRGDPPFTWDTIIEALRAPIVGEDQLAKELEKWLKTAK